MSNLSDASGAGEDRGRGETPKDGTALSVLILGIWRRAI